REQMLFCFPLLVYNPSYTAAVGAFYDEADLFMGQTGEPVGIACYKPYHSYGDRLLHEHFGMIGLPLDPYPYYSENAKTIFLTADAAWDKDIIAKIKQSLLNGSCVFITSGLYEKLSDKGIKDILPVEITNRKITTDTFTNSVFGRGNCGYVKAYGQITMPHAAYNENDLWVLSSALTPYASHPFILNGAYGKGKLYIITIPDAPADLYKLPVETLNLLRREMSLPSADLLITLECGSRVGLFPYNNKTFILQSFLDRPERIRVCINKSGASLVPIKRMIPPPEKVRTGENESVYEVHLLPGRYAVLRIEGL
ncbi:MAG: hypothetical protein FWD13_13350, partial [Treponema sp.]|nr:hypothetical protein [Treponema sp.]